MFQKKKPEPEQFSPEMLRDGLKFVYKKIRPIEEAFKFDRFYTSLLNAADFDAKPFVLLIGQYSTGKTTFIRYLLGRDFPGQNIGPEPTTDRFMAVMEGPEDRLIPGHTLAVQTDKPFQGLERFGSNFLNKFQGSFLPAERLEFCSFIDTPGVLAGEKQTTGRNYEYSEVVGWFAQRADLILLLFDAHKLDVSDEYKQIIQVLRDNEEKIRVVLNKADSIDGQQLMRVYGALMWSLGKVVNSPECMRVYIGSFWEKPCQNEDLRSIFEAEKQDLFKDLTSLPRNASYRKVNEFVKRARALRIHVHIFNHLREQMPLLFGKQAKQDELIQTLSEQFTLIQRNTGYPASDFPDVRKYQQQLGGFQFDSFPKITPKILKDIDDILSVDIPWLLNLFPNE